MQNDSRELTRAHSRGTAVLARERRKEGSKGRQSIFYSKLVQPRTLDATPTISTDFTYAPDITFLLNTNEYIEEIIKAEKKPTEGG
jgi:hypothetical protein